MDLFVRYGRLLRRHRAVSAVAQIGTWYNAKQSRIVDDSGGAECQFDA